MQEGLANGKPHEGGRGERFGFDLGDCGVDTAGEKGLPGLHPDEEEHQPEREKGGALFREGVAAQVCPEINSARNEGRGTQIVVGQRMPSRGTQDVIGFFRHFERVAGGHYRWLGHGSVLAFWVRVGFRVKVSLRLGPQLSLVEFIGQAGDAVCQGEEREPQHGDGGGSLRGEQGHGPAARRLLDLYV